MALNTGWVGNGRNKTFYEMHIPEDENANYTPLILLSGGPGLSYKTLLPLFSLAEHVPVLSYDQIGSGKAIRSDKLTSLNIEMYINQFEVIIDKLDIEEFHLLGHSWGTVLALHIAFKYPDKVKSLILHSGIADWQKCQENRSNLISYYPDSLKEYHDKIKNGVNVSPDEVENAKSIFNANFYCRVKYPDYLINSLYDKDHKTNSMIWDPKYNKKMAYFNVCSRLNEIKCPTLITAGKYDGISVGQDQIFLNGIPNSTLTTFEHSVHYAHVEERQKFTESVRGFLGY